MKSRMTFLFAIAALASCAVPAFADLEFTPFVGRYTPTNNLIDDQSSPLVITPAATTTYGGGLTWWVSPRVGLEAAAGTAQGKLELLGGGVVDLDYRVLMADARVRFRLSPEDAPAALHAIGGIGITHHWNGLFDGTPGIESKAAVTAVLGLGADVAVTERFKLRFDLTDRIHNNAIEADATGGSSIADDRSQHDVVFTVGLAIPVWAH
jgi:Outer membrane protein beta-barrel domain